MRWVRERPTVAWTVPGSRSSLLVLTPRAARVLRCNRPRAFDELAPFGLGWATLRGEAGMRSADDWCRSAGPQDLVAQCAQQEQGVLVLGGGDLTHGPPSGWGDELRGGGSSPARAA
ncbi:hypothetical protein GCM10010383_55070 [Streptomyces lomondensis]|uniref:Uncharacterized protein n=1 Tax=Streptomyces lomondensis TaxID=68229 RepID=A0ABQ2XHZ3_9ACTN|nr:hypothetical protein GCM10010383_55070 [Streptomyces lomondensis]